MKYFQSGKRQYDPLREGEKQGCLSGKDVCVARDRKDLRLRFALATSKVNG